MASRSASFDRRTRSEDSWVEISSQPSSSSLSSIGDEVITTGLRVQHDPRAKRRRTLRRTAPSSLNISHRPTSTCGASSQEEYEESESESDRVMTSSNEGPILPTYASSRAGHLLGPVKGAAGASEDGDEDDDDDENRTAINYPIKNDQCFTPQPNAFSHPPTGQLRNASQPVAGSYFPSQRRETRPTLRPAPSSRQEGGRQSHMPQNILSPSYEAAAQHEEALRTSLSTLLSCAAAARSLGNTKAKQAGPATIPQIRGNRVEPMNLRLLPESRLPASSPPQFQEPTFNPTLRRKSTSTSTSSEQVKENKRKAATGRSSSREHRALKKARRSTSAEDLQVSPTLLTWVVSAGVVVVLSALSFSAGYSAGKEAGRLEASSFAADEQVRSCAREAGRSGLGLKRSLARSAVQV
ncbi:hypothetical protein LTR37_005096 [Vermiconidia calcicola]|uniref:Uncharacterized protein n=1 Tax=Vermiconidia calcicola TaxID=1690605 RepID=A0ACC3NKD5_9PEZI|nr:hypothetical protein LTR37_005096 [Vermiconidia calcicola]